MENIRNVAQGWGREIGLGFLYWLTFLLVLEPGNLARANGTVALDQEAVRILGASLLGATSTPLLLALTRRFPIEGGKLWRHATIHSLGSAGISLGLIVLSCVLAAWLKVGDSRPVLVALPDHVAANWLLLAFCLAAFTAVAHAVRFWRHAEESRRLVARLQSSAAQTVRPHAHLTRIEVKSRGRVSLVDLSDVDWIETQGNYLALHTATGTHLVRDTLASFETKLDPNRFVRIHRRTLVALDGILEIAPLASGDATIRLANGTGLRLSRNFRDSVRTSLSQRTLDGGCQTRARFG